MFVRAHVGVARVHDQHLVQQIAAVAVRADADALPRGLQGLRLEPLDVVAAESGQRRVGVEDFLVVNAQRKAARGEFRF